MPLTTAQVAQVVILTTQNCYYSTFFTISFFITLVFGCTKYIKMVCIYLNPFEILYYYKHSLCLLLLPINTFGNHKDIYFLGFRCTLEKKQIFFGRKPHIFVYYDKPKFRVTSRDPRHTEIAKYQPVMSNIYANHPIVYDCFKIYSYKYLIF